jgi:uncharacterized protein
MKRWNNFHVIKDPVHGVMQFTNKEDLWIKPFINHPNFQRLRHIKQVGLADLIFPGAVHTRFNHGLGCCYVGSQIANKIKLDDHERQLVMIANLVHDIGHGPFSHTFEDVFINKSIRHEDWTPYFLQEFCDDEFIHQYNLSNPDFPLSAARMDDVEKMIMHKYEGNKVLADIVSSQLDADRFDYLLRDSHFCGVKYGQFDLRWMLHCLVPVETEDGFRLGVNYKGVGVVEHYLMARRLMIRNIYHHYKKHAIENLLIKFLEKLSCCLPKESFLKKYKDSKLGQLLMGAQKFNKNVGDAGPSDEQTKKFLKENFELYKHLGDGHVLSVISELAFSTKEHDLVTLAQRIYFRQVPEVYPLDISHINEAQEIVDDFKAKHKGVIRDWQLDVISTPQLCYTGDDDPIYVLERSGKVRKISDLSLMLGSLSDKYEHSCSLFIDCGLKDFSPVRELIEKLAPFQ